LTDVVIFLRLFENNQKFNMTGAMKEQVRKIVLEFKRRLSADLQKRVIKFILYGSRARGVDAEDSDLDFTKTGKIDPKFHLMLVNARKIGEIADYDIDEEIVESVALLKIDEGHAFLSVIKDYLGQ